MYVSRAMSWSVTAFVVVVLVWFAVFVVVGSRAARTQDEFLRRLRLSRGGKVPLRHPLVVLGGRWHEVREMWKVQPQPDVEEARRIALQRVRMAFAVHFVMFIVVAICMFTLLPRAADR